MTKYIEIDGIGEVVSRSEYDALAAQVEALQARIITAERVEEIFSKAPELSFEECKKLFPEEIRSAQAEAGWAGFIEGVEWQLYNYNEPTNKIDAADKYADSIRSEMSETDYLMSSPENAERLMRSIQQVKGRK